METVRPDEQAVLDVLQWHRGRAQAIGLDVLAASAGLSERTVQYAIASLIESHGQPIGSATMRPAGYYLIETADELAESLNQLTHRIISLARRIAALKQSTTPIVLNQLALEIEETQDAA